MCFCMLGAVDGELCLLEVLEAPGVMRRVLLCMLEAAEGGFCLLEAMEAMELLEVMDALEMHAIIQKRKQTISGKSAATVTTVTIATTVPTTASCFLTK